MFAGERTKEAQQIKCCCCLLQLMTDVVGNPEEERRAAFYHEPWSQEAVSRYFYCKVTKRLLCRFQFRLLLGGLTFCLLVADPAEEAGAGAGFGGSQHLSRGPSGFLRLTSIRCVFSVCVCMCEFLTGGRTKLKKHRSFGFSPRQISTKGRICIPRMVELQK